MQDIVLRAQEALQVLGVRGHLLGHGVHTPCVDQSLHEEQRHPFLLTIHYHLQKPEQRGGRRLVSDGRMKIISGLLVCYKLRMFFVYDSVAVSSGD